MAENIGDAEIVVGADTSAAEKALLKTQKSAEAAAKKIEADHKSAFAQIGAASAALSAQVGGNFGRLGSVANSALRPLIDASTKLGGTAQALTLAGAAAGGAAVGLLMLVGAGVSLASGLESLGEASGAAGERLKDLGLLTSAQTGFAADMALAVKASAIETDLLTVRLAEATGVAGELTNAWVGVKAALADGAGAAGTVNSTLTELRRDTLETVPVIGDLANKFGDMWVAAVGPGSGNAGVFYPINAGLKEMAGEGHSAALALEDAAEAAKKLRETTTEGGHVSLVEQLKVDNSGHVAAPTATKNHDEEDAKNAIATATEFTRKAEAATRAYEAAMRDLRAEDAKLVQEVNAQAQATAQLGDIYDSLHRSQLGGREQIQADLDAQLSKIADIGEKSGDLEAAWKAAGAAEDDAARKLNDYDIAQAKMFATAKKGWADIIRSVKLSAADATNTIDNLSKSITGNIIMEYAQATAQYLRTSDQILGSIGSIEQDTIDSYTARQDAGEKFDVAEQKSANNAIKAQRDISLVQAGISATLAGLATYVDLTASLVPAPAAAVIAAGVTAASFAAAASGIKSGTPAFFTYSGKGGSSGGDPVNTNYVTPDAANSSIDTKGGNSDAILSDSDSHNGKPGAGNGSQSRTRGGGQTVTITMDASTRAWRAESRPGKAPRRGGAR